MATYVCYDRKGIYGVGSTPREALRNCRVSPEKEERMIAEATDRAAERLNEVFADKQNFYAWDGAFIGRGAEGELLDLVDPFELELIDWYWRRPMGLRWSDLPDVEEVPLSEDFAVRRSRRRRRGAK